MHAHAGMHGSQEPGTRQVRGLPEQGGLPADQRAGARADKDGLPHQVVSSRAPQRLCGKGGNGEAPERLLIACFVPSHAHSEWEGIYVLYTYGAKRQTARNIQLLLSKPEAGSEGKLLRHITLFKC